MVNTQTIPVGVFCYIIQEDQKTAYGEYIPCILISGQRGFIPSEWAWGRNLEYANRLAAEKNRSLGVDKATVESIRKYALGE